MDFSFATYIHYIFTVMKFKAMKDH